ncbi:MAG: ATP-binding protein [Candidatus Sedimenticola sp. (ex Thyasira tokunagai)]
MKIGITGKLIIVLLVTTTLLVAAMAIATRWSFQKGFIDYLTEAELSRLDPMAADLAETYQKEGGWEFIRGNHRAWMSYLPHNQPGHPGVLPPPLGQNGWHRNNGNDLERPSMPAMPQGPERRQFSVTGEDYSQMSPHDGPRFPPGRSGRIPPAPPNDRSGLSTRLRLFDENQQYLIGPPDTSGKALFHPIRLDGVTIGWLNLSPLPLPATSLEQGFRDEQLNAIYPIAIGALLLALLMGIPMGRHLLRPVKEVAKGAHALTQGRFSTRLELHSQDELGRLADDFNNLAEVLERNEQLRRQGMADVSHELRTPLALLRGEIEAMQDGIRPLDSGQLERLHSSVMQLSSLVDDLYDLALADAGALSYRKERLDLADILTQAASTAEQSMTVKHLSFHMEIPDQLPLFADAQRIRQVIDNLLKNSHRYTAKGGNIVLSAWREGDYVSFKVEDSAPGVSSEILPRLFDRFYRGEISRNRASGGAGLGLSICRKIVEAHHGKIIANTSPLGGLQVQVTLPMEE